MSKIPDRKNVITDLVIFDMKQGPGSAVLEGFFMK